MTIRSSSWCFHGSKGSRFFYETVLSGQTWHIYINRSSFIAPLRRKHAKPSTTQRVFSIVTSTWHSILHTFKPCSRKPVIINGNSAPGLLGLLLTFVPNLQRLSLQITDPAHGVPAPARATALAKGPLSMLRTLENCSHSEGHTMFSLDHHATGPLEAAKRSLKTLNFHMCGEASRRIGKDKLHLRHLCIKQSHLTGVEVELLMSACAPGLRHYFMRLAIPTRIMGAVYLTLQGFPPIVCSIILPSSKPY